MPFPRRRSRHTLTPRERRGEVVRILSTALARMPLGLQVPADPAAVGILLQPGVQGSPEAAVDHAPPEPSGARIPSKPAPEDSPESPPESP